MTGGSWKPSNRRPHLALRTRQHTQRNRYFAGRSFDETWFTISISTSRSWGVPIYSPFSAHCVGLLYPSDTATARVHGCGLIRVGEMAVLNIAYYIIVLRAQF